jgi:hypothetical protein
MAQPAGTNDQWACGAPAVPEDLGTADSHDRGSAAARTLRPSARLLRQFRQAPRSRPGYPRDPLDPEQRGERRRERPTGADSGAFCGHPHTPERLAQRTPAAMAECGGRFGSGSNRIAGQPATPAAHHYRPPASAQHGSAPCESPLEGGDPRPVLPAPQTTAAEGGRTHDQPRDERGPGRRSPPRRLSHQGPRGSDALHNHGHRADDRTVTAILRHRRASAWHASTDGRHPVLFGSAA